MRRALALAIVPLLVACGRGTSAPPAPAPSQAAIAAEALPASASAAAPPRTEPPRSDFGGVALPDAKAPASVDYIAFEPRHSRVWVPVGGTGSVDVFDTKSVTFRKIDGFKTAERATKAGTRVAGPSAVTIGEGAAYIGNRATREVCPVDTETLAVAPCITLDSPTDGVAYVASSKEVWVTTPQSKSIVVLDASKPLALKPKTTIHLAGAPEGYAVDAARGLFFTNLEDRNETVVLDVAKHEAKATWHLGCDPDGPRGVATDGKGLVFVACTNRVLVLDAEHDGAALATIDTGAGVDNLDWLTSTRRLYVAAGKAGTLTIAHVDEKGHAETVATLRSSPGARNAVVDSDGKAYVTDAVNARLMVFAKPD